MKMNYKVKSVFSTFFLLIFFQSCSVPKQFYDDGSLKSQGKTIDGQKVGEWKYYHSNGTLWQIGHFEEGKQDGEWVFFYENGNRQGVGTLDNGKRIGKWIWYHESGQLYTVRIWNNGKLKEVISTSDGAGNKVDKGTIEDGNGTVKFYDIDGNLTDVLQYKNGELVD